jgi:thioredoxin-like negative regulator of GroEL
MVANETRLQEAAKQIRITREAFEDAAETAEDPDDADAALSVAERLDDAQEDVADALDMLQEEGDA